MATLSNFQLMNQLTTTTSSGAVDPNGEWDCVPTCIAAGMQFLTGLKFQGGILKEAVYGLAYQGATSAGAYVQYCAQHGVHLYSLQGSNDELIAAAHMQVQAGHPTIITIPDPYIDLTLFPGYSHVEIFFGEDSGELTALDPYIAQSVTQSDSAWSSLLQFGELWILEKIVEEEPMIISLSTPGIASFYSQAPGSAWKCNKNGLIVGNAILSFYRMLGGSALCGLTYLGLPTSNERGIPGKVGVTEQDFERATLRYDPGHVVDNPPGSGVVYLVNRTMQPATPAQSVQVVADPATLAALAQATQKLNQIGAILR